MVSKMAYRCNKCSLEYAHEYLVNGNFEMQCKWEAPMKVVDLMKDLEKGDRSMEHLKVGGEADGALTFRSLQNAVAQLGSGLVSGLAGSALGLGFANQQAQGFQQFANQQQAWGGQPPWNR